MIKRLLIIIMIGIGTTFLMNGCYYDKFQELHPMLNTACDSASATYSTDVSKIISAYCVSCHSGSGGNGGISLNNYDNVRSAASSGALINALTGNGVPSMPPNTHLDDCKVGSIKHWVKAGMPNN